MGENMTSLKISKFLDVHLPGSWVGRDVPIPWPPRSPDVTPPLDFFLWGYVKDIVNKTPVTSLDELKLGNRNSYTANAGEHLEGN
jgi:hypothetical protein